MKKYKLINRKTNKETICDKVVIDGFDYYVSDVLPKDKEGYWVYIGFKQDLTINKCNVPDGWFEKLWDKANYKTPIATNNPNIDIPQVLDEVQELADEICSRFRSRIYFKKGYNKAKEQFKWTNKDMIDFASYVTTRPDTSFITVTELIELMILWQESNPKVIYYE